MLTYKKVRLHLTDEQVRHIKDAIERKVTITLEPPYTFQELSAANQNHVYASLTIPAPPPPPAPARKPRQYKPRKAKASTSPQET